MEILEEVSKEELRKHLTNINLEDQNLYNEVQKNQFGVFQFSGGTASGMIQKANVDNFNDLVSINALSRPGSSFSFPDFCRNGNSGESKYPEFISKFLNDSRGCILFQEQIMHISSECGLDSNYVRGLLKKLGKANKKKEDIEAWDKVVKQFEKSFAEKGMSDSEIRMVIDDFVTLSAYSFNKSHASAYSYLAAETIYLSKYFKSAFYAANLTYEAGKQDKLKDAMKIVKKTGYKILPPSINNSSGHFAPVGDNLAFGLGEIKGIGEKPMESIVKNRPYESIIDFVIKNLGEKPINKRVTTALVAGGAFDDLIEKDSRKKYLNIVTDFYEKKKTKKNPELLKQLWDDIVEDHQLDIATGVDDYMKLENDYLGGNFFHGMFSDAMVEKIDKLYSLGKCLRNFEEVREQNRPSAYVPLQVKSYRYHTQKNGQEMCFLNCEDMNGEEVSIPVFASYWEHCKIKFFGEAFYLLSVFDKEGQIMFGSRNWVTSPDTKRSFMIRWKI